MVDAGDRAYCLSVSRVTARAHQCSQCLLVPFRAMEIAMHPVIETEMFTATSHSSALRPELALASLTASGREWSVTDRDGEIYIEFVS